MTRLMLAVLLLGACTAPSPASEPMMADAGVDDEAKANQTTPSNRSVTFELPGNIRLSSAVIPHLVTHYQSPHYNYYTEYALGRPIYFEPSSGGCIRANIAFERRNNPFPSESRYRNIPTYRLLPNYQTTSVCTGDSNVTNHTTIVLGAVEFRGAGAVSNTTIFRENEIAAIRNQPIPATEGLYYVRVPAGQPCPSCSRAPGLENQIYFRVYSGQVTVVNL